MFLLDTNVLSALMMMQPPREIAAWVSAQPDDLLFTAAVCQAEILTGIAILPEGRRRAELAAAAQAMFSEDFEARVLPFDTLAAQDYADMYAACRSTGRPTAALDLMIAAIARVNGASVVTRNVADFEASGVPIINPWVG
jgi:hypothetical protein